MNFSDVQVGDKLVFVFHDDEIGGEPRYGEPKEVIDVNITFVTFESGLEYYPYEITRYCRLEEAMELHPEEFI